MPIIIRGCDISNNGVGISAPHNADMQLDNTRLSGNGVAIELRDVAGVLQQLGLPSSTEPQIVIEALEALNKGRNLEPAQQADLLRSSKLIQILGVGADVLTVASVLLPLLFK